MRLNNYVGAIGLLIHEYICLLQDKLIDCARYMVCDVDILLSDRSFCLGNGICRIRRE